MIRFVQLKRLLLMTVLFCVVGYVYTQTPPPVTETDLPYFCRFEDSTENANWEIDTDSYSTTWEIGKALSSSYGEQSLYVSADGGVTAGYDQKKTYVAAYRDFTLSVGRKYEISFEWINPSQGKLYACWFNPTSSSALPPYSGSSSSGSLPTYVQLYKMPWVPIKYDPSDPNAIKPVLGDTLMNSSAHWQKGSFEVTGTGVTMRLLFFWQNDMGVASTKQHGAAIDNVQVGRISQCGDAISEVTYVTNGDGTATFSWKGGNGSLDVTYDLMFFDGDNWTEVKDLPDPEWTIPEVLEAGTYTIWIRMKCFGTVSNWYILNDLYVHEEIEGCLDYLDIYSPAVKATYGSFANPAEHEGVVNDGPGARSSHLTIHSDRGELDSRTGFELSTVPEGSQASVRLGNWGSGAEAESVTYDYTVEESSVLMLLKYAIVMENPNHDEHEQPKFKLEILNARGDIIDSKCGTEDFIAGGDNTVGWNQNGSVQWKDWTGFGLNLAGHIGENIKIRLTTYDCSLGGHYAYAYFTLNCAEAKITGLSCAGGTVKPLKAPEGFTYKWYPKGDENNIVSEEREFMPGQDDHGIYVCEMTYKGGDCQFSLEAAVEPRTIVNDFTSKISFSNCEAQVKMINNSRVEMGNGKTEACDSFRWKWADGRISTEKEPLFTTKVPGDYEVTLTSKIAGGDCFETTTQTVTVPEFGDYEKILNVDLCEGDPPYEHDDHTLWSKPGVDTITRGKTACGCDSVVILDLKVNKSYPDEKIAAELFLYKDEYYEFNGQKLTDSGEYYAELQTVNTGCDSLVTLNLMVYPRLELELPDDSILICGNDLTYAVLPYELISSSEITETDYLLEFDEKAGLAGFEDLSGKIIDGQSSIEIPIPETVRPDVYQAALTCRNDYNGTVTRTVRIVVSYSSAIVAQKWNDVLALYNEERNGGYTFSSYQWYKDGEPLLGETKSYLYAAGNLDPLSEYKVLLTRADDGVAAFTCPVPVVLKGEDEVVVYPTVTERGGVLYVKTTGKSAIEIWNVMGVQVASLHTGEDGGEFLAPDERGTYLVSVKPDGEEKRMFTVLVK